MIMAFILIKIFGWKNFGFLKWVFRFKSFRGRWINKISLSFEILYHETSFEMIIFHDFFQELSLNFLIRLSTFDGEILPSFVESKITYPSLPSSWRVTTILPVPAHDKNYTLFCFFYINRHIRLPDPEMMT